MDFFYVHFFWFVCLFVVVQAIEGLNGQKPDNRCHDTLLVKRAFKKARQKRYPDVPGLEHIEVIMNKNTNNVYFRGLPKSMQENDLMELCQRYGDVTAKRIREPGVAFVRFKTAEQAGNAIRQLNGAYMDNSKQPLLAKLANAYAFFFFYFVLLLFFFRLFFSPCFSLHLLGKGNEAKATETELF